MVREILADEGMYRYVTVEKRILEMLEKGVLSPGDKLPSLRGLGSKMSLSVSTINQAYIELEKKGVIESRPKSGFYIRNRFRKMAAPKVASAGSLTPGHVNKASIIRSVLNMLGDRQLMPLSIAYVGEELLPIKRLNAILSVTIKQRGADCWRYSPVTGDDELRTQIARRLADIGVMVRADELIVTNGTVEALYIAMRCVTRPGDAVVIASPTYYCFLQLIESLGLRAIELPSHPDTGISPNDLENAVSRFDVKACVLTPNFNNPDGSLIPEENKEKIVSILAGRGIPLIEDDIYGELYFNGPRPVDCRKFDKDNLVIQCSSFSKTMAAGYRIGWIVPGRFYEKAFEIKATTNVCTATPNQIAVAEYLRGGDFDRHLKRLRPVLEKQMRMTQAAVAAYFPPETRVTTPKGGTVLWLELPETVNSIDYFYAAGKMGIGVAPGIIFSTQDKYNNHIRISFGIKWSEAISDGLTRLGELASRMAAEKKG